MALPNLKSLFQGLPGRVREALNSGQCFLIIDYSTEGYTDWILPLIYGSLDQYPNIPPHQVILLCGDARCETSHSEYSEQRRGAPINVHYLNMFRQKVADDLRQSWRFAELSKSKTSSDMRRYLCLNRRNRLHRQLLVSRLLADHRLDLGLVSLPNRIEGLTSDERSKWEYENLSVPDWVSEEMSRNFPRLHAMLPLTVDAEEMSAQLLHTFPLSAYEQTRFSVVTETLYFENALGGVFVTEKTWKAVAGRHPFILFSNSGTLAQVAQQGFETFDEIFSANYDAIEDHGERFNATYQVLTQILDLCDQDFDDLIHACQAGVERNRAELLATDQVGLALNILAPYAQA